MKWICLICKHEYGAYSICECGQCQGLVEEE
jgi:hypothetical protein